MNTFPDYMPFGRPAEASVQFKHRPVNGNTLTINGVVYTFGTDWGSRFVNQYVSISSVRDLAELINGNDDQSRGSLTLKPHSTVFARAVGDTLLLFAREPGTAGNSFTLATNNANAFVLSGATFTGGAGTTNTSINTIPKGADNLDNNQVTAGIAASTLVAARPTRRSVTVVNIDAAITVYIGKATVTTAVGVPLLPNQSISLDTTALIQVIAASGTPKVAYVETYD